MLKCHGYALFPYGISLAFKFKRPIWESIYEKQIDGKENEQGTQKK